MPREPLYYCYRLLYNERQFGVKKLAGAALEFGEGQLAGIEFLEQGFLSKIIFVYYTRFALEHAPGFPALDGEENHLAGDRIILHLATDFRFDIDAKVRHAGTMIWIEDPPMHNIILGDEEQHFIHVNQLAGLLLFDRFHMLAEAAFGQRPVR